MVIIVKKKPLALTAALCFSMMFFAGCGNAENAGTGTDGNATAYPATASPMYTNHDSTGDRMMDDAEGAMDDVGEGAKDVIDGARDAVDGAVDGAADGTKRVIDGVTDNDDTDREHIQDDANNSVTSGKN